MKKIFCVFLIASLLVIYSCVARQKPEKPTEPTQTTETVTQLAPEPKLPENPPKLSDELLNELTEYLKEKLEERNIKTVAIFDYFANYTRPTNWVGKQVKNHSGIYIDEPGKAVVNFIRKYVVNRTPSTEAERDHLDKIIDELGKNLDGKFEATAERLGNLKIADAFIFPRIHATFKDGGYTGNPAETKDYKHKLIASYTISVRMVDVATREVFWIGEIPSWEYECFIIRK